MIGGDNDNKNNCSKDHESNINNNYNDGDNCFNDDDQAKNGQVNSTNIHGGALQFDSGYLIDVRYVLDDISIQQ